ncbi:MAG: hypothetical protein U9R41_04770 [Candidatus Marinimicrobia bacterium]|nr:hypothetical protein [Candidatus Neomarinimicrobiota bacterium]
MNYNKSFNWNTKVNDSKNILICMPSNKVEINIVNQFLDKITLKQDQKIDIIYLDRFKEDFILYNYYNREYLYPNVKNINHFPIKEAAISYIDNQYDITIDLNTGINILSNYIAATKAKNISVGFNNKFSKDFLTATIMENDQSEYNNSIKTIFQLVEIKN